MGSAAQEFLKHIDENNKELEKLASSLDEKLKVLNEASKNIEKMFGNAASLAKKPTSSSGNGTSSGGTNQSVEKLAKELGGLKGILNSVSSDVESLKQKYGTLTASISAATSAVSSFNGSNIETVLKQQTAMLEDVAKAARTYNEVMTKAAEIASRRVSTGSGATPKSKVGAVPTDYEQEMQGSKAVLAEMRKYYAEREKLSAQEAAAQKRANDAQKRANDAQKRANDAKIAEEERFEREYAQVRRKELSDLDKRIYEETKRQAAAYQAKLSTPQGALDYSSNAKTLQQQAQAILYLKSAREKLDTTDTNYRKTLKSLNDAIDKHKKALDDAKSNTERLSGQHRKLLDISGQLQRQIALIFSVSQIKGFIAKIATVRGEFELQQRSLESLLQNKTEADKLFTKTVQLAVRSPYTIKQMVSFNKQLAAYRIESDQIYDTMKRLADVSAGLGVDMQRIILAYGQVKAAAYLRGCLGLDTEIVMYDGSKKKVQDIAVGDLLHGDDDKPRIVKELIRGKEQMYKVSGGGYSYRVNKNHILTLYSISREEVVDVYVEDYLANTRDYLGVRYTEGSFITYTISVAKDEVDNYFGFVIDQNKRFLIGDNVVTHNTEVRQFTEAGVNLYGELQNLYRERGDGDFSTAQIVDMISKRKVSFEDVEEVFKRLTDEGGLFYNMQETQSETLQGKIANLKDSYDIMLNSIGESNESVLKGTIDVVSVLLNNWEKVLNVVKVLIGVFLLLKLQSIQSGVALKNVFSASMTANANSMLKTSELLKLQWYDLSKAVKTFGANLKAAFASNAILLAILAVVDVVIDLAGWFTQAKDAINEVTKAVGEMERNVFSIKDSFNAAKTIEKQRAEFEKLRSLYENAGLDFNIDIQGLKEEDIKKSFESSLKDYKEYLRTYRALSDAFAKRNNAFEGFWGIHFGGDNLKTDTKDVLKAYNDVLDKMDEMRTRINGLYDNYDTYGIKQQQALNGIRSPRVEEDDVEYLMRAQKVIDNFFGKNIAAFKSSVAGAIGGLEIQLGEFDHELDGIFEDYLREHPDFDKNNPKHVMFFRAALNAKGAEEEWNEFLQKHAEDYFGISLKIDKKESEKELDSLSKQIDQYFKKKRFTIDLTVGITGLKDALDEQLKAIKEAREDRQILKRAKRGKYGNRLVDVSEYNKVTGENIIPQLMTGKENTAYVSLEKYLNFLNQKEAQATKDYIDLGGDPNDLIDKKKREADKQTRDILKERLELLKKLNSQYEELRKNIEGDSKAASDVMENNREAIAHVGLNLADSFVPSKENVISKLRELYPSIKEFNKKQDVWNTIGDYLKSIQLDEFNEKAKEAENNIKGIEKAYELFKKLKDEGLSKRVIRSIIPDLPSSLEEVERSIEDEYNKLRDANGQLGLEKEQERQAKLKELRERYNEELISDVQQLVKDYGVKLSEQLQLDMEYYKKLSQICAKDLRGNYIIQDEGYRATLESNIQKEYNEKTGANKWKEFQNSDYYVRVFQNLENVSSATLGRMKKKIESLKSSMKDLSPTDLKAMEKQISEIEEKLDMRDPLGALLRNLKIIRELGGLSEEEINQSIEKIEAENEAYKEQIRLLTLAQNIRDGLVQLDSLDENTKGKVVPLMGLTPTESQAKISGIQTRIDSNTTQLNTLNGGLDAYDDARRNSKTLVENLKTVKSQFSSLGNSLVDLLEAAGEDSNGIAGDFMQIGDTLSNAIIETINWTLQLKLAGVAAKSAMGYIGYILMILETIVSIMTTLFSMHDKKLSKEIENIQEKVNNLDNSFNDLKDSMNSAWDINSLVEYKHESEKVIDEMILSYQRMIALEEQKKHTDRAKVNEYKQTIKELQEEKKELEESEKEAAGGFGSEENYKSAAQAFADAWLDAYNSAESGLDALNDTWDEYIENLVKKQIMLRVTEKLLHPVFDEINKAVDGDSEGGIAVTQNEFSDINKKFGQVASTLDETFTNIINNLGYLGSSTSNLQNLQQGIKNITETQAAAIESYLNSVRFFVSNEQADVAAILTILQFQFGSTSSKSASSQMISELSAQTSLLRTINSNIEDAYRKGWKISNL